jgi:uncharacterized membrane protein
VNFAMPALALLLSLGAGLVGGVFFAFSTFVMKALAGLPAANGVAAMQRINVVVLNPLFLGAFVGTAGLGAAAAVAAALRWTEPGSSWLVAAGVLYLAGSFGVTIALNVPRNERLARLDPSGAEAAAYWPVYVREWSIWNHVRAVASIAAAAAAAIALAAR